MISNLLMVDKLPKADIEVREKPLVFLIHILYEKILFTNINPNYF